MTGAGGGGERGRGRRLKQSHVCRTTEQQDNTMPHPPQGCPCILGSRELWPHNREGSQARSPLPAGSGVVPPPWLDSEGTGRDRGTPGFVCINPSLSVSLRAGCTHTALHSRTQIGKTTYLPTAPSCGESGLELGTRLEQ